MKHSIIPILIAVSITSTTYAEATVDRDAVSRCVYVNGMFYPKSLTAGKTLYGDTWIAADPSFYDDGGIPQTPDQFKQIIGDINIHQDRAINALATNLNACISDYPHINPVGLCTASPEFYQTATKTISDQIKSKSVKPQERALQDALFAIFCGYQAKLHPSPNDPLSPLPSSGSSPFTADFSGIDFTNLSPNSLLLLGRTLSYWGLDLHNLSPSQVAQLDKVSGYSVPTSKFAGETPSPLAYSNISGMVLPGLSFLNLYGANASTCDFSGSSFSNGCLDNADFTDAVLDKCNFAGTSAQYANFIGASFKGAKLAGVNLKGSMITAIQLAEAENLSRANLRETGITEAALQAALAAQKIKPEDPRFQNISY